MMMVVDGTVAERAERLTAKMKALIAAKITEAEKIERDIDAPWYSDVSGGLRAQAEELSALLREAGFH